MSTVSDLEFYATREMQEQVLKHIRLRARRRIEWLRREWQIMADRNKESASDHHSEVDGYIHDIDSPADESEWWNTDEKMQALNDEIAQIETTLYNDETSRLRKLSVALNLSKTDVEILQTCFALSLEPNLGRVYAYAQDHSARGYVTTELIARFFGYGRTLPLSASSSILRWRLIVRENMRTEPECLSCDPFIRDWLLGANALDPALVAYSSFVKPLPFEFENWPLVQTLQRVRATLSGNGQKPLRLFLTGCTRRGQLQFASLLCSRLDIGLLSIDSDRVPEMDWPEFFLIVQRYARLSNTAVAWTGDAIVQRQWQDTMSCCALQFIVGEALQSIHPVSGLKDVKITLPELSFGESRKLYQMLIPSSSAWPDDELNKLLLRHSAGIEEIIAAWESDPASAGEAEEVMRSLTRTQLGTLAQPLLSKFTLDDLVIPKSVGKQLSRFSFEAQIRNLFWERPEAQRLFPQGQGLMGLLTGMPGTGKTMAAQAIANTLGLPIFRIDLASVVSRYVGDTAKNLASILKNAGKMNVLLFFDEADAIFSKRISETKDAQDHFINSDLSFLLMAVENYSGISLLATNKKSNMDPAFLRRLRYVIDFPRPEKFQRLELWTRILSDLAGEELTKDLHRELENLAQSFELTGAQIKFAILTAIFIAEQAGESITVENLIEGIEVEMQKEGRGLSREVRQRLVEA